MNAFLTPTELARETGLDRREVISRCIEYGVAIHQGRIDKELFIRRNTKMEARMKAERKKTKLVDQPTNLVMPMFAPMPDCGTMRRQYARAVGKHITSMVEWLSQNCTDDTPLPEPFIPLPYSVLTMISDIAYAINDATPNKDQQIVVEVEEDG